MPDNQRTGALEDFVVGMIAAGDELWPKAQADVIAIEEDKRRFRPTYLTKAQVHTWLAWQGGNREHVWAKRLKKIS